MYRELGVQTVCPTTVGAKLIRDVLIKAPWETQTFDLGKLSSVSTVVGPAAAGKRVSEIEVPGKVRIAAVRRGERDIFVASPELVLQEGDELSAIIAPDAISDFAQRFRDTTDRSKVTA
jgi:Trk K+ transport system NAD-binding subunit